MTKLLLIFKLILASNLLCAQVPRWEEYTSAPGTGQVRLLERPLLVILVKFPDLPNVYSREYVTNKFFNPEKRNVTGYFNEISYGQFTFKTDTIIGWIIPYDDPETMLNESNEREYWQNSEISFGEKSAYLLRSVDDIVDFSEYDIDNDKIVSPTELSLLWIYPSKPKTNFAMVGKLNAITLDDCKIDIRSNAVIEEINELGTCLHELTHLLNPVNSEPGDLYSFKGDRDYQSPETFSILANYNANSPSVPHLDPYSKYHSGWVDYQEVTKDSWITLNDVETHGEIYRINNPADPGNEYILLENRWPGNSYEGNMDESGEMNDTGLAIWHVKENGFGFERLNGRPMGFRDRMKLLRPTGSDNSNRKFLWDNNEAGEITWDWSDGTESYVFIKNLSPHGQTMRAYVDLP